MSKHSDYVRANRMRNPDKRGIRGSAFRNKAKSNDHKDRNKSFKSTINTKINISHQRFGFDSFMFLLLVTLLVISIFSGSILMGFGVVAITIVYIGLNFIIGMFLN